MRCLTWITMALWLWTSAAIGADADSALPPRAPTALTIQIQGALLPDEPPDRTTQLSLDDLAALPREQVRVGSNQLTYEGVSLAILLERAGMKWEKNCSPALASYVLVEASDGYRAVFALPEIHPAYRLHKIILAEQADGRPLQGNEAPWRLVEEREDFAGRWVRQVAKITVRMPPAASASKESTP